MRQLPKELRPQVRGNDEGTEQNHNAKRSSEAWREQIIFVARPVLKFIAEPKGRRVVRASGLGTTTMNVETICPATSSCCALCAVSRQDAPHHCGKEGSSRRRPNAAWLA